jgi:two-component system sensor histidine kinase/response regulator
VPRVGSTFTVHLPLEVASAAPADTEPAPLAAPPAASPARRRPAATSHPETILVAEDNKFNQQVIVAQLNLLGYRAEIADDGRAALARWREGSFALLLTDLQMPEMDGFELTASVRREEFGRRRMPILALTANALKGEAERCTAAGMDGYLTKPVQLAQLQAAIERWLGAGNPSLPMPLAAFESGAS